MLTLPGEGPGVNCTLNHLFQGEPTWLVISRFVSPPPLEIVGEPTKIRVPPSGPTLTLTEPAGRVSSNIP